MQCRCYGHHRFAKPNSSLRWRQNGHDGVSNHQPHHCLLNRLFGCRSKKTSKIRVTGLCAGNSPGTGEFPAQMASNVENVSIWWRHHVLIKPDISRVTRFELYCLLWWCVHKCFYPNPSGLRQQYDFSSASKATEEYGGKHRVNPLRGIGPWQNKAQ